MLNTRGRPRGLRARAYRRQGVAVSFSHCSNRENAVRERGGGSLSPGQRSRPRRAWAYPGVPTGILRNTGAASSDPVGLIELQQALVPEVFCTVLGAVQHRAAGGAGPPAGGGGQVVVDGAAVVAGLGGGKVFLHHQTGFSLPGQLVGQEGAEHAVSQGLHPAQTGPLGHFGQVGILDAHGVPGICQTAALLVEKILALVGEVFVQLPQAAKLLFISPGPPLHAGQLLLCPAYFVFGLCHPAGQFSPVALAVHIKVRQGEVQAHRGLRRGQDRLRGQDRTLKEQGAEIFAGGRTAHCGRLQLPPVQRLAVKFGFHFTGLGQADAVGGQENVGPLASGVVLARNGIGFPAFLFPLIGRVMVSLGIVKKMLKGFAEVLVDRSQGAAVGLLEEGGFLLVLGRGGEKVNVGFGVKLLLIRQNVVPEPAAAAEGLFKEGCLGGRWVEPDLDGGVV